MTPPVPEARQHRLRELANQGRRAWRLFLDGRVPGWQKAIPVLAALYIISPIDVLPEAVLGPFGAIDDVLLALLALRAFNHLAGPYAGAAGESGGDAATGVGDGAGGGAGGEAEVAGPTIDVPYRVR